MNVKTEIPLKGLEIWACEWEDAHYNTDETSIEDMVHRAWNYISVGILLKDDDVGFAVATDIGEDGKFRGINFVPAKMVIRKWRIGLLKPKVVRKTQLLGQHPLVVDTEDQPGNNSQQS
jgi:hypothetical protein